MAKASRIELPSFLTGEMLTGLDEIDAQHAYFLGLVRAISEVCGHSNPDEANALVLEIARYAQSHFAFEETMMDVYSYPDREQHVAQHASILRSIRETLSSGQANFPKLRLQMLSWLSTHIPLDDGKLAQFVIANRPRANAALV